MRVLKNLSEAFRQFGPWAGLLYLIDRALGRVWPDARLLLYEMMEQPVPAKPLLPPRLARNLSWDVVEPEQPVLKRFPIEADVIAARFRQGGVCLCTYRKGELLGYLWINRQRYDEDEARCTYELGDPYRCVFDYDLYVMPEHRMGLAFAAIWHGANEYLREQGVTHTYSRLTRFNVASRRAHSRLGWQRVGRVLILRLGRLQLLLSDLPPFVAMSASERGRPRLRLPAPSRSPLQAAARNPKQT